MGPKVLLLDEITSALDPELVGEVLSVVQGLARDGMTMVVVTHEMTFARDVGSRIVFMDEGRVVVEGPSREVLANVASNDRLKSFLARIEMKH
jgi:polar amino acid transport system ATP-binding protein